MTHEMETPAGGPGLIGMQANRIALPLHDNADATRFLRILDPAATSWTFQTFDDNEARRSGQLAQVLHGTLAEHAATLEELNRRGAGVFVTVNETDGTGRKADNIQRVRAVFADFDGTPLPDTLPLTPHLVVESSPGKWHVYWRVEGLPLEQFSAVQLALVEKFGSDKNVKDLSRVMRLPGFLHQKGTPWLVQLRKAGAAPPYPPSAFLPLRRMQTSPAQPIQGRPVEPETVTQLRSALYHLRADDRELWIAIGQALYELGDVGRGLWLDWSQTSEKWKPTDAKLWDGFKGDRTGYQAVFARAQAAGWINPTKGARAKGAEPSSRVIVASLSEILVQPFPPRELLLAPWLASQSLTMLHAWRGTGKTHVALGIAHALACGGAFLNWRAVKPVPVLYIDGEMPGPSLKARLAAIVAAAGGKPDDCLLRLVTPDLQPDGIMPDLATPEGQRAIEAELGDARVIVVDNISCLVRSGAKENDAESWGGVAAWALRQRARGRSVVFIHHSGKGGQQRGTSKREDVLDTVIALRRPTDYEPEQGARFEIHFEKGRDLKGQEVNAIEAWLQQDAQGRQVWCIKDASNAMHERIIEMTELGLKPNDIAQELGCNRATVYRHLKTAMENGEVKARNGRLLHVAPP